MEPSLAVVGATGAVGEIMRRVLAERRFAYRAIKFLASERSAIRGVRARPTHVVRLPPSGCRSPPTRVDVIEWFVVPNPQMKGSDSWSLALR